MSRQIEGAPSGGRNAAVQIVAAIAIAVVVLSAIALNLAVLDSGADAPSGAPAVTGPSR